MAENDLFAALGLSSGSSKKSAGSVRRAMYSPDLLSAVQVAARDALCSDIQTEYGRIDVNYEDEKTESDINEIKQNVPYADEWAQTDVNNAAFLKEDQGGLGNVGKTLENNQKLFAGKGTGKAWEKDSPVVPEESNGGNQPLYIHKGSVSLDEEYIDQPLIRASDTEQGIFDNAWESGELQVEEYHLLKDFEKGKQTKEDIKKLRAALAELDIRKKANQARRRESFGLGTAIEQLPRMLDQYPQILLETAKEAAAVGAAYAIASAAIGGAGGAAFFGVGAVPGAGIGAAGGFLAGAGSVIARRIMMAKSIDVMRAAIGAGYAVGNFKSSRDTEAASLAAELIMQKDDAGNYLPLEAVKRTANLYGTVAGTVEATLDMVPAGETVKAALTAARRVSGKNVGTIAGQTIANNTFAQQALRRAMTQQSYSAPLTGFVKSLGKQGIAEGVEEGLQQAAQLEIEAFAKNSLNATGEAYYREKDPGMFSREGLAEIAESAKEGGLAGMWFGLIPSSVQVASQVNEVSDARNFAETNKQLAQQASQSMTRQSSPQRFETYLQTAGMSSTVFIPMDAALALQQGGTDIVGPLNLGISDLEQGAENGQCITVPLAHLHSVLDTDAMTKVADIMRRDPGSPNNQEAEVISQELNGDIDRIIEDAEESGLEDARAAYEVQRLYSEALTAAKSVPDLMRQFMGTLDPDVSAEALAQTFVQQQMRMARYFSRETNTSISETLAGIEVEGLFKDANGRALTREELDALEESELAIDLNDAPFERQPVWYELWGQINPESLAKNWTHEKRELSRKYGGGLFARKGEGIGIDEAADMAVRAGLIEGGENQSDALIQYLLDQKTVPSKRLQRQWRARAKGTYRAPGMAPAPAAFTAPLNGANTAEGTQAAPEAGINAEQAAGETFAYTAGQTEEAGASGTEQDGALDNGTGWIRKYREYQEAMANAGEERIARNEDGIPLTRITELDGDFNQADLQDAAQGLNGRKLDNVLEGKSYTVEQGRGAATRGTSGNADLNERDETSLSANAYNDESYINQAEQARENVGSAESGLENHTGEQTTEQAEEQARTEEDNSLLTEEAAEQEALSDTLARAFSFGVEARTETRTEGGKEITVSQYVCPVRSFGVDAYLVLTVKKDGGKITFEAAETLDDEQLEKALAGKNNRIRTNPDGNVIESPAPDETALDDEQHGTKATDSEAKEGPVVREGITRKDDSAEAKVAALDVSHVPEFNSMKEFGKWVKAMLATGENVTIAATKQSVSFTNKGTQASLKRARSEEHRKSYEALREMVQNAEYDHYEGPDARHPASGGQDVYYSALRMDGKLYSVKIKLDVVTAEQAESTKRQGVASDEDTRYKDHKLTEIKIAPALYRGLPVSGQATQPAEAISKVSLGILRGSVKPSKLTPNTDLSVAEINEKLAGPLKLQGLEGTGVSPELGELLYSLAQVAYHGSPYNFDKFTLSKMGAGEGAQVHGWGLYFALERAVSEGYRNSGLRRKETWTFPYINGEKVSAEKIKFFEVEFGKNWWQLRACFEPHNHGNDAKGFIEQRIKTYEKLLRKRQKSFTAEDLENNLMLFGGEKEQGKTYYESFKALLQKRIAALKEFRDSLSSFEFKLEEDRPQLYRAEIPDDDVMLREEAKFEDQPEKVQAALKTLEEKYGIEFDYSGKSFYRALSVKLGSDKAASEALNSVGVKGIRYNGRRDGECAVVFDDKAVTILETYYQRQNANIERRARNSYGIPLNRVVALDGEITKEALDAALKALEGLDLPNVVEETFAQINRRQRGKLQSGKAYNKSINNGFSYQEHRKLAEQIAEAWKWAAEATNTLDERGDPNVRIIRYIAPVLVRGENAFVWITVKKTGEDYRIYSAELLNEEKLRGILDHSSGENQTNYPARSFEDIVKKLSGAVNLSEDFLQKLNAKVQANTTKASWAAEIAAMREENNAGAANGQLGQNADGTQAKLERDSKAFGTEVDRIFSDGKAPSNAVRMLTQTPLVLQMSAGDAASTKAAAEGGIYVSVHTFHQAFAEKEKGGHPEITADVLKQIPAALTDPLAILDSETHEGDLVYLVEVKDKDNANTTIVLPVVLNVVTGTKSARVEINLVKTAYGKFSEKTGKNGEKIRVLKTGWFENQLKKNARYANGQKLQDWAKAARVQFPIVLGNLAGHKIYNEQDLVNLKKQNPGMYSAAPDGAQTVRGATEMYSGGRYVIRLFRGADMSTLTHESAHVFFEMMERHVREGRASDTMMGDWDTLQEWQSRLDDEAALKEEFNKYQRGLWDGREFESLTEDERAAVRMRAKKEMLARGFEQYMREGKAPSSRLAELFSRMKRWLTKIYRSALDLNIELTDEVRGVFNRILEADAEMDLVADRAKYGDFVEKELDALGLTGEKNQKERDELQTLLEEAKQEAADKLFAAREKMRRARIKGWVEEAKDLADNNPAYQLLDNMRADPLNYNSLVLMMGEERARQLKRKFPKLFSENGTAEPAVFAGKNGFDSLEGFYTFLLNVPTRKEFIQSVVDSRMEEHAQKVTAEEMFFEHDKLMELEEKIAQILEKKISRILARPRYKAEVEGRTLNGQPVRITQDEFQDYKQNARKIVTREQLKARAYEMLMKKTAGEVLKPEAYRRQAEKYLQQERRAILRGDWQKALDANYKARINMELAKRAEAVNDFFSKVGAAAKKMLSMAKADKQARYAVFRLAVNRLGLFKAKGKWNDNIQGKTEQDVNNWFAEAVKAGYSFEPEDIAKVLNEKALDWHSVTLEELIPYFELLGQIVFVERKIRTVETAEGLREFEEFAKELSQGIYDRAGDKALKDTRFAKENVIVRLLKRFHAAHLKADTIALLLDDDEAMGPVFRAVIRPIREATFERQKILLEAKTALRKLFGVYSTHELMTMKGKKTIRIPGLSTMLTKEQALCILLNAGNESNLRRVINGYDLTREQIQGIIDQLDEKDVRFAQSVWDYFETFRERAFDLEERVTGVRPHAVEAKPLQTRFGTLRGGYYPVEYDPDQSARVADPEKIGTQTGGFFPHVDNGSMKARSKEGLFAPLELKLDIIPRHAAEMAQMLAFREPVLKVARIIKNKNVEAAITETRGVEVLKALDGWLHYVAGERPRKDVISAALSFVRRNTTMFTMGYKLSTAIVQAAGTFSTISEIGAKWTAIGIARTFNGGHMLAAWEFAKEMSPLMRVRILNIDRDIAEISGSLLDLVSGIPVLNYAGLLKNKIESKAFLPAGFIQLVFADLPTWHGAYAKAIAEGKTAEQAAEYADVIVERTQVGGMDKDLAGVQRDSELSKLFTMFYSYFSALYQLSTRRIDQFAKHRNAGTVYRLATLSLLCWFTEPVLSALMTNQEPEDDEGWAKWAGMEAFYNPFNMIVGVRELANFMKEIDKPYASARPSAALDIFTSAERFTKQVKKALEGKGDAKKLVNTGGQVVGRFVPAFVNAQGLLMLRRFWDYLDGTDPDFELMELVRRNYNKK